MNFKPICTLGEVEEDKLCFSIPVGLAEDGSDTLAVADLANNRIVILKVSEGEIKSAKQIGDFGNLPGKFDLPIGVQFDRKGNLIVTEIGNHRVQKFNRNFKFILLWGGKGKVKGKFNIPNRIAVDDENNIYIVDEFNRRVQKFGENGELKLIFGKSFHLPQGIAFDHTDKTIWVCDTYANKIKKYSKNGEFIFEFGKFGTNLGEFNLPRGLFIEKDEVLVADRDNHRIQKLTKKGEPILAFGGFPSMTSPVDIVKIGRAIYVSEAGHSRISVWEDTSEGVKFKRFIGSPRNKDAQFSIPSGVAISDEFVYVTDSMNHRVQIFNREYALVQKWGKNEGAGGWDGFGTQKGEFFMPMQVFSFKDGVYVADSLNHRIQIFKHDGEFKESFGSLGSSKGQFNSPMGVAVDRRGNIYVADSLNHRIQKFSKGLEFLMSWGKFGYRVGEFNLPFALYVDKEDNVYVVDRNNNRVQKFDEEGGPIASWGARGGMGCKDPLLDSGSDKGEFLLPAGVCVQDELAYVADWGNSRVQVFDTEGRFVTEFGELGGGEGAFFRPCGIAVNKRRIYVTDQLLNKLFIFEVES